MRIPMFARAAAAATTCVVACLVVLTPGSAVAADDWAVPQAEVRYSVKLEKGPTDGSAGYFAHLPDGGLLPGPFPATTVVVRAGGKGRKKTEAKELASYTLWHGKQAGLYIVFADPGGRVKQVDVYISGSQKPQRWSPESGLTPSAILCNDPSEGSLRAAKNLGGFGKIDATTHALQHRGVKRAPFSIGGDLLGRPKPGSFYFLAHLKVKDPGRTWIAPFILDGESEIRVNGKKLDPEERIDKWGGTGDWVDLKEGAALVEVFQSAPGSGTYESDAKKGGLMYLTWRRPNATMAELGGVRSNKVPMTGTSRMETRIIGDKEIMRSGSCSVQEAVARGGIGAACVRLRAQGVLWFESEIPLIVYQLEALTAGHPEGCSYEWEMPGGGVVKGSSAQWIFPGLRDNAVKLTVTSGSKRSQCVQSFFGSSSVQTDLSKPKHREAFRKAMTQMVKAYPDNSDAMAKWPPAYWNNLIRTAELNQGYELLENLFTERHNIARERLSPAQLAILQDVFLDAVERRDPQAALKMIDKLQPTMGSKTRSEAMLIRKAEVLMFQLGDVDSATRGLAKFMEEQGEIADWARIRLGDIAFMKGDLNKATEFYSKVQSSARQRRNKIGGLVTDDLISGAGKDDDRTPEARPHSGSNWRIGALRDVSNSENVIELIEEGYLLEAREALRLWEREFPLSKISGDLLLMDARYHMALGDWKRGRAMLEAYCKNVDASSFLPEALRQLIRCVEELKTPRGEVRELFETAMKRLKYHPVAAEIEEFLEEN